MVPAITDQQRTALNAAEGAGAVPVFDPVHQRTYYLVPAHVYERLNQEASDFQPEAAYPLMDSVARREGWDDPEMDVYDQLDPRKQE